MRSAVCTGITASWCPIHGDCTCPVDEHGTTRDYYDETQEGMNSPHCPLHAPTSTHGEKMPGQMCLGRMVEL